MTFPIEESLLTCYRGRESCLNNDLPKEVSNKHGIGDDDDVDDDDDNDDA